jgi:hypothetical protein
VEVFDPASTRVHSSEVSIIVGFSLYSPGSDLSTENIFCLVMDICEPTQKTFFATPVLLLLECIAGVAYKWVYSIVGCVFVYRVVP